MDNDGFGNNHRLGLGPAGSHDNQLVFNAADAGNLLGSGLSQRFLLLVLNLAVQSHNSI